MEQPDTTVQDSVSVDTAVPETPVVDDELLEALPEQQDDEIEDDLDGVKVRGKKESVEKLRAERLMQADYTKKTQALAENVKATEAAKAETQQRQKFYEEHIGLVGDLVSYDRQIAQFQGIDWNALSDSDPVQALKLDRQLRNLQEQKAQGMQKLGQMRQIHSADEQRRAFEEQQSNATRLEKAADYLRREIPNWTPQRDTTLGEYAVKQGVPASELANVISRIPAFGKVLHKAELYDQLVARQAAKPKTEGQEAPVTRITATKASGTKDPSAMTDADFAAWRKRQIAARK